MFKYALVSVYGIPLINSISLFFLLNVWVYYNLLDFHETARPKITFNNIL